MTFSVNKSDISSDEAKNIKYKSSIVDKKIQSQTYHEENLYNLPNSNTLSPIYNYSPIDLFDLVEESDFLKIDHKKRSFEIKSDKQSPN